MQTKERSRFCPSRRQLLKLAGAAGFAGFAQIFFSRSLSRLGLAEPAPPLEQGEVVHQWTMVIDLRLCDGCGRCTEACQLGHNLPEDMEWIKIYEIEGVSGQKYFLPRPCMQCDSPPCTRVCPVQATYKLPDGVVFVDQDKCIGCRMCMAACPYGARYFNWKETGWRSDKEANLDLQCPTPPLVEQKGTVGKCFFCFSMLRQGKLPHCVEMCTGSGMSAIYIGDYVTDLATNGEEVVQLSRFLKDNDAFHYKEELGTKPRVYYISGHGQAL